ncbi:hypothetical protein ACFP1H_03475 [Secundilactobacillus hailunensis]|uniref:DUF4044 domain-containing protein n=1 Tax=Secundilactobacillus hailunensis TaxID=2559923 RepID=A0ABW1T6V3_9LACO|nr:hypothetical protein [Secundilactobacillus hailunensis]
MKKVIEQVMIFLKQVLKAFWKIALGIVMAIVGIGTFLVMGITSSDDSGDSTLGQGEKPLKHKPTPWEKPNK